MKKKKYIEKSYKFINSIIPITYSLNIQICQTKSMKHNFNIMGLYNSKNNTIYINPYLFQLSDKEIYKVIFHEIGHSIHFNYLDYIPQYLPRKHHGDMSYYCNSNQKESFAECFADYMWKLYNNKMNKIIHNKRLAKMHKILMNKRDELI